LLRRLVFPFGKMFAPPRDTLDATLAAQMMEPSEYHSRVTCCVSATAQDEDNLGLMAEAVEKQIAALDALAALKRLVKLKQVPKSETLTGQIAHAKAQQLLSEVECSLLATYDEARQRAIAVDDFAPEYFQVVRKTCENQSQRAMSTW
jgi:hypothetical protein